MALHPHLHSDGLYVVSMTRFEKDYVRVPTLAEACEYVKKGFSLRMSNPAAGLRVASLITPSSIKIEI
jgi:hypothetical protein